MTSAFDRADIAVTDELVALTLAAGANPSLVLERSQLGGPGIEAVIATANRATGIAAKYATELRVRRTHLDTKRQRLIDLTSNVVEKNKW